MTRSVLPLETLKSSQAMFCSSALTRFHTALRIPLASGLRVDYISCASSGSFPVLLNANLIKPSSTQLFLQKMAAPALVIWGKEAAEAELAANIKKKGDLNIDGEDQLSVFLACDLPAASLGSPKFRAATYFGTITTNRFGRLLLWSPRLPSTHDIVSQNFCHLPIGAVCVADIQLKGRGRSKNMWESPPGCLMFSFSLQIEDGHVLPLLQYVVSLAVTEAIQSACTTKGYPQLDVKLKWPNDIYLQGLKVGGVLCTSTYRSKMFNVTVGIGLNLDNDKPTTCLNHELKKLNSEAVLQREDLLALFFNKFESLFEVFMTDGFLALEALYYKTWLHGGQRIYVENMGDDEYKDKVAVTIQGLTSAGYLLVIGDDDKYYELHPDGNSFDFWKGLVRKKVEGK